MSCLADLDLVRRHAGVMLRYSPHVLRAHHIEPYVGPDDRERVLLLNAERELRILEILTEHLQDTVSLAGIDRICEALFAIHGALQLLRGKLAMPRAAA